MMDWRIGYSHSSDRLAGDGDNTHIQGGRGQVAGHPHSCHLVVHGLKVLQQHKIWWHGNLAEAAAEADTKSLREYIPAGANSVQCQTVAN